MVPLPYPLSGDGVNEDTSSQELNQCTLCQISLPPAALKKHMSEQHGDFMPFQCSLCGKGFRSSTGLKHHELIHMGMSFRCPICQKTFTQKSKVKRHLQTIHKCQPCFYCERVFSMGQEYDQHIVSCSAASKNM